MSAPATRDAFAGGIAPLVAALVTVLVGFTSSYALVVQAGLAMGLDDAGLAMGLDDAGLATMTAALALGIGLTTLVPSLLLRIPVVTAWSTPGAALLVVGLDGVSPAEAVGAFLVCGVLLVLAGVTGWFARAMARVPLSIASALLAGVLLRFGLDAFASLRTAPAIVAAMLCTYVVARRASARFSIPLALAAGAAAAWLERGGGPLALPAWSIAPAVPLAWPALSATSLLGVALPLFVVTMASQNVPGMAVLQAHGYRAPTSALIAATGAATLLLAPFGAFAINLAAITAALCMGPEAHADPARRWLAAALAGTLYLATALFAAPIAAVFTALPRELVAAIAGLALLPTIARGLQAALADERERDPALVTFLVTASGLTLWGIGPAFWGVLFGAFALLAWAPRRV